MLFSFRHLLCHLSPQPAFVTCSKLILHSQQASLLETSQLPDILCSVFISADLFKIKSYVFYKTQVPVTQRKNVTFFSPGYFD